MMGSEQLTPFAVVWGTGLLLGWFVWRLTRFLSNPHARWLVRSLFLALVVAPGLIHAHGTFMVPAVSFLALFVVETFSGHERFDLLLHALLSIILTWAMIFGLVSLLRHVLRRDNTDA